MRKNLASALKKNQTKIYQVPVDEEHMWERNSPFRIIMDAEKQAKLPVKNVERKPVVIPELLENKEWKEFPRNMHLEQ